MNNRTEDSRARRQAKTKKRNYLFVGIIAGLILVFALGFFIKNVLGVKSETNSPNETAPQTDAADPKAQSDSEKSKGVEEPKEDAKDSAEEEAKKKEERAKLEEERKAKYGEFYVPLPAEDVEKKDVKAKGLYLTSTTSSYAFDEKNVEAYANYIRSQNGETVTGETNADVNPLEEVLGICLATEVNALVIDIKSDDGYVTWESDIDIVNRFDTVYKYSQDNFKALLDYMKAHEIHPIARIVVFKDHLLPSLAPDHAMLLKEGGLYVDGAGVSWVNPFDKYVWDYVISISKEAALRGFEEIHFDYVRFPDNAAHYNEVAEFPGRDGKRKDDNIEAFLQYAKTELEPYGVNTAAAVFGIITKSWEDETEDIGQTWIKIGQEVDTMSPMIYPSHYSTGWYGYEYPDQEPYGVFNQSLLEAIEKNSTIANPPKIRPWIQGFTAPWVDGYIEYTPEVIAKQIIAGRELGIDEYLIWDANNQYDFRIFNYESQLNIPPEQEGVDDLARTAADAASIYMNALVEESPKSMYLIQDVTSRDPNYQVFRTWYTENFESKEVRLSEFTLGEVTKKADGTYTVPVTGTITSTEGNMLLENYELSIKEQSGVYKVVPITLAFTPAE